MKANNSFKESAIFFGMKAGNVVIQITMCLGFILIAVIATLIMFDDKSGNN